MNMKSTHNLFLCSALAILSLQACEKNSQSSLSIVGGRSVWNDPEGPALRNVVGLSVDGRETFCTGSIVAKDIVVTAAHCVRGLKGFYVVFGEPNGLMPRVEVEKVETYKSYGMAAFPNFDIAWLKLKTEVPDSFKPMEVLRDPSLLKNAEEFRLAGYGMEKTNCREASCNDELLQTNTNLEKYYDTPRMMSLLSFKGSEDMKLGGACNGDSGGPAYARIGKTWYLIGVTNGTTAYANPESWINDVPSCEARSALYTFMGDYVPWLEKLSSKKFSQVKESNPDRSEAPFVIKGEQKPADLAEPQTWAEWIQYPYHNEQAWNTVESLLMEAWTKQRPLLAPEDEIKLWVDPEFSQARVQELTFYQLSQPNPNRAYFPNLPPDLRPLASWTGLQEVSVIGENAAYAVEPLSRLPNLRTVGLNPGTARPHGDLDLKALQKAAGLNSLTLVGLKPTEIESVPFGSLTELQTLRFSASSGLDEASLDLSGLKKLKDLRIASWDYASRVTLPKNLALTTLELKLDHATDLKWLNVDELQSVETVELGSEVLNDPIALQRFKNKGVKKLIVPGSRLKNEDLTADGFAAVEELVLSGNLLNSTGFLKDLPALKKADLRDNPLAATDCPAGISCTFDRFPNPKTVGEFCRNTVISSDYAYTPLVKMLLLDQGFPARFYSEFTCDALERVLSSKAGLVLDGSLTWTLPNGLNYDLRVLKSLKALRSLTVRNVTLANAEALAELPALTSLDLASVKTKNPAFISRISKLETLNYTEFPFTNLEGLSHPNLKVLMLSSEGRAVMDAGRVQTIGAKTALPALTQLSLRGNPLKDLKGVESMRSLLQLDITDTRVSDLSPLNALIGATVFFGSNYELDTCPILYGSCQTGSKTLEGANFGSDGSLMGSKWIMGQAIPGLGKALRN